MYPQFLLIHLPALLRRNPIFIREDVFALLRREQHGSNQERAFEGTRIGDVEVHDVVDAEFALLARLSDIQKKTVTKVSEEAQLI